MKTMELRRVPYGTTFTAFGDQFVALDYIGGGVLAIRKETWKNVAFDSNGVNDLRSASIGQALEDYLNTLKDGGAKISDILNMTIDLKATDGTREYGFHCGGTCRWGTADKRTILGKYAEERGAIVLVGIAADEAHRREKEFKPYKRFPLIDWGMSEADCLVYCYERGHEWREHGAATPDGTIRLYDILDRVSCWCCTNKNLDELRNVYHLLPEYWERLKDLQRRTCRPMKGEGKSVFDLETRFKLEDESTAAGLSIRSREFFGELAARLERVQL